MNFSALTSNSTALYTLIGAGAFAVAAIVVGVTLTKSSQTMYVPTIAINSIGFTAP